LPQARRFAAPAVQLRRRMAEGGREAGRVEDEVIGAAKLP